MSSRRVTNAFKVHRLNSSGLTAAEDLARAYNALAGAVAAYSRGDDDEYARKAIDKLEESCFFAKKSIAVQKCFQEE